MKESDLYALMHRSWPEVHCTRIENTAVFGVPDVNCAYQEQEFWIEHKMVTNHRFEIRPTQLAWLAKRIKVNGRKAKVFIMAADDKNWVCHLFYASEIFRDGVLLQLTGNPKVDVNAVTLLDTVVLDKVGMGNLLKTIMYTFD